MDKDTANLIMNMIEVDRSTYGRQGSTFAGARDMYSVLGYPRRLDFEHYNNMYQRQDIASRVVRFPAEETWAVAPLIFDGEAPPLQSEKLESTKFEKEWELFAKRYNLFPMLVEADVAAGIGHFGIIVINVAGDDYKKPLEKVDEDNLSLFSLFNEGDISTIQYESDRSHPRYGQPKYYHVNRWVEDETSKSNKQQDTITIHHSRVIHISENSKDGITGIPRLRGIYNRMIDLEKLSGGGSEATWKMMDKGFALDVSPEFELSPEDEQAMLDQLGEFDHGLRRFILTRGVNVNPMGSDVVDPTGMYNVILDLISATSGIPRRILVGSERGELASSQDERNWARTIASRQQRFAEPVMLRPLIDRLILLGVLPVPTDDFYEVRWQSIMLMTPHEKARITAAVSAAIVSVAQSGNIITPQEFRSKWLELPLEPEPGYGELKEGQGTEDSDDEGGGGVTAGGYLSAGLSGRKKGSKDQQENVDDTVVRASIEALFRAVGGEYESIFE